MHDVSDVAKFQQNKILHGTEEIIDEEYSHFITHSDTMIVTGIVTSPEISCELSQTDNQSHFNFLASLIIEFNGSQQGSV